MESEDFNLDRKLTKTEICQGTLLLLSVVGLLTCATLRGCQEVKKHMKKLETKQVISHKMGNAQIFYKVKSEKMK